MYIQSMMKFKQITTVKKTTVFSIAITLSAIVALAPTLDNQNVFADVSKLKIENNLDEDLIFDEIKNKQGFKIKTSPPNEIKSGETKSFEIKDSGSVFKNQHLNVKYFVDESGSDEKVTVGIKTADEFTGKLKCFAKSPSDVKSTCKRDAKVG